jgi:hypothetical protein
MPTPLTELIPMMNRELNAPGTEQYPDMGAADYLGYIADGFWDARLATMLTSYTILDGLDLVTPEDANTDYFTDQSTTTEDLPEQFQMLVVIYAGARLLRNKILTLAVNYKATAGPVDYEQQASATTLRAILATLQKRMDELKRMYSDDFSPGTLYYMDGPLQRVASDLNDYLSMTVL